MANRNFNRKQALEKEVKEIYADISFGVGGAPTLVRGTGIASVTRSGAGVFVITLQDKYMRLMAAQVSVLAPVAEDIYSQLVSEDVDDAKTVTIRFVNSTATEVDPDVGDSALIRLDLKNSSAL